MLHGQAGSSVCGCCTTCATYTVHMIGFLVDSTPTVISLPLALWSDLHWMDDAATGCFLFIWMAKEYVIKYAGSPTDDGAVVEFLTGIRDASSSEQMNVYSASRDL